MAANGDSSASGGARGKFEQEWEVGDELGTGTYATVRRVRNRKTGQEAAVKILVKDRIEDLDAVRTEMDVLQRVGSAPHVVHLQASYETKRHMYFVMELCSGGELFNKLLQVGVFSERTVANMMKQILTALQHCHKANIVHRDLKPENLLMSSPSPDAELKVADFGVSKVLDKKTKRLQDLAGSPMYIAPEVITHKCGGYSFPADLWSAGVIMFCLLGGYPPFDGPTDDAIMESVATSTVDDAMAGHECWDIVSDEAKDLLHKLLDKNPATRCHAYVAVARASH